MHEITDDGFESDAWETLPETVERAYEPWQRIMAEDSAAQDSKHSSSDSYVYHLLWLVPLARALQLRRELRLLHPLVHHAVIELKMQPHSIPQHEYFTFYAEAEGLFTLSFDRGIGHADGRYHHELGRGNARHVAELLVRVVKGAAL